MAFLTQTRPSASVAQRANALFSDLSERFARYRVYRRTLDELSGLSTRELNDLGLNKSMLKRVAHEAAYSA